MEGIRESENWTDEKHNMYIKSIEASFVNHLYDSKQTSSFSTKPKSIHSSTAQFKVLRGGCWQKMNFERDNSQICRVNQQDLIANPWIQHYRNSSKIGQFHMSSESQLCQQNMISSDTEMSDQNFIDEEVRVEKEKTNNTKRRKSFDI